MNNLMNIFTGDAVDMGAFMNSLKLMGFGMLSILLVMLIIYLLIFVLNKTTSEKKDEDK